MKITMTEYRDPYKKKINYKKFLFNTFNVITSTTVLALIIKFSSGYLRKNLVQITTHDVSSTSKSMSEEKIIAWFCAGALGYAAFYAIGKNIAEK